MNEVAEPAAVLEEAQPGRMLAQLRKERGMSLADVAQRLKYGPRQIEALEAEEFGKLPGATFVRGMVRGYAKLLEVDPQPMLKALERRQVPGEISMDLRAKRVPFPEGGRRGRSTRIYLWLSLITLVAVGGVFYEWHSGGLPARIARLATAHPVKAKTAETPRPPAAPPPVAAPAPAPAVVQAAVQAAAPPPKPVPVVPQALPPYEPQAHLPPQPALSHGLGRIRIETDAESWVEIKEEISGRILMSQLVPGGSRRTVSGQAPMAIVIGNAAAVRLTYNESPVDLKPYVKIEVARLTLD